MIVSRKKVIRDRVFKNLLSAHERIADDGCVRDVILLTKFILKLTEKGDDVLVDVAPEGYKEAR